MDETLEGDFNEAKHYWDKQTLPQDIWEQEIKNLNIKLGWVCDRDDETTLGFSDRKNGCHWIKDYNKKTRTFVQFDGNYKVNLVSSKEVDK